MEELYDDYVEEDNTDSCASKVKETLTTPKSARQDKNKVNPKLNQNVSNRAKLIIDFTTPMDEQQSEQLSDVNVSQNSLGVALQQSIPVSPGLQTRTVQFTNKQIITNSQQTCNDARMQQTSRIALSQQTRVQSPKNMPQTSFVANIQQSSPTSSQQITSTSSICTSMPSITSASSISSTSSIINVQKLKISQKSVCSANKHIEDAISSDISVDKNLVSTLNYSEDSLADGSGSMRGARWVGPNVGDSEADGSGSVSGGGCAVSSASVKLSRVLSVRDLSNSANDVINQQLDDTVEETLQARTAGCNFIGLPVISNEQLQLIELQMQKVSLSYFVGCFN